VAGRENARRLPSPHSLPPDSATRLRCAEGDQTSGEVPGLPLEPQVGPVVTGPPVVPASADCFGASRRSRATDAEAQAEATDAAAMTR